MSMVGPMSVKKEPGSSSPRPAESGYGPAEVQSRM